MRQVNMHEAGAHLSRLVEEVVAGEPFVICKAGRPMVRVMQVDEGDEPAAPRRRLGLASGHGQGPDDFLAMAPAEITKRPDAARLQMCDSILRSTCSPPPPRDRRRNLHAD